MLYAETNSTDPTWNLAFEEYCFEELRQYPQIMLLWQNANTVVIGRYQNAESEINFAAAKAAAATIVRRSTGGGAVYHDLGNLNYSFIFPAENIEDIDFSAAAKPMVEALRSMGVPAEPMGRNDLVVEGKKISGTAQRYHRGRMLYHGTLLFDSNLDILEAVLRVDRQKILSKGISSVKSRVTNIRQYLPQYTVQDFWRKLVDYFAAAYGLQKYQPTRADLDRIAQLQREKYRSWDWTMGEAPEFQFCNSKRFPAGRLEIRLNIKNGSIEKCKIHGDFLGLVALDELENSLVGVKFRYPDVRKVVEEIGLSRFLGGISAQEFLVCMFT